MEKPKMMQASELPTCPFCGSQPYFGLGKKGSCQLHGEPFQSVIIFCKRHECPVKPKVAGGDIYNGGEAKARIEVAKLWNTRHTPEQATITNQASLIEQMRDALRFYRDSWDVVQGNMAMGVSNLEPQRTLLMDSGMTAHRALNAADAVMGGE